MLNNDILRRLRYALDISDPKMIECFKLGGYVIDKSILINILKKEDEQGYIALNDKRMDSFLNGFIILKRGKKEESQKPDKKTKTKFNNNVILKKLRIALKLTDVDIRVILKLADLEVSKSELSALFRREDHKHFKVCGDQFLRNFLIGLAIKHRKK